MTDLGRAVLGLIAHEGSALLPSLTREELRALGDQPMLTDVEDERWWAELSEDARGPVVECAQRGLVARGLLVATDDADPDAGPDRSRLAVAESVQVVLRARHEPAWLIVLGEPTQQPDRPGVQVAVSGIDLRAHRTSAALLSVRLVGIYTHRLAAPAIAVDAMVDWLMRPAPGPDPVGRTVQVILPAAQPGGVAGDVRAIVLSGRAECHLADVVPGDRPGEPRPVDRAALRHWLIDAVGSLAGVLRDAS